LNEVLGSLTLGGYDVGRFTRNNATFPFSTVDRGELSVQLQSISMGRGAVSLLPSPIAAYLDSSVPYLYLPVAACSLFETAFGLVWNDTAQLYFISDTQRILLQAQNPSVVFTLGTAAPNQVNISLPYLAFDLTASWPLVPNATRYFPLKRANDSSQYTLGRVFFQEAYMIADYERGNFSISQCKWDSSPQNLVPILALNSGSSTQGLSTGIIAGIGAGGAILIIIIALLLWGFWWKPRHRKQRAAELSAHETTVTTTPSHQAQGYNKPELDSNELPKPQLMIHEADSRKVAAPIELGEYQPIYEMPGEDSAGELSASPISSPRGGNPRFSWRGGQDTLVERSITPGMETMSSISSGWGSTHRTLNEIVSPATTGEPREQINRGPGWGRS